ncbi:GAP family protein [Streptomyces sp. R302]|uniref:GAP family protein n=1 Tax=unclassified Streptomyces TaxID=2593676 RepID=UPI00145F23DB|nr:MULTISPECIES: GAP family protein [unclassified Streptomyces]NML52705.1 GAP family protein [Streptomyces sp. R301]NML80366.1 GAP family protein [Streptomyces sp. R302]
MALDLLLIGLAVTLFPLPVMAFVLVLASPRGVRKGLVFILAWVACLVLVITLVLLLTGGEPPAPRSPPSVAALWVSLLFGVGLVGYGVHRWRRVRSGAVAPKAAEEDPADRTARKGASLWSAAALAVLLQPWGMVGAAAATVVHADLSEAGSVVALAAFCLVATSSLLAMELSMVFAPERSANALMGLHDWLRRHKEPAVIGVCLALGLWLISRGLYQLA